MEKRKKSQREGTNLSISKGRSGRRRTVRTKETIKVVWLCIEDNARNVSCGRNGTELRLMQI